MSEKLSYCNEALLLTTTSTLLALLTSSKIKCHIKQIHQSFQLETMTGQG